MMLTFYPRNDSNMLQVNHINGIKDDNRLENLEWVTQSENTKHAFKLGLINQNGERNPISKLTEQNVIEIRRLYATGNYTQDELAHQFGVIRQTIGQVVKYKTWRHIK